ncbi:MAG: hypothetical protein CENE_03265 [Candidatus Celerinatantimonas neptuna]|nr:MAG: hypothetical protein CENE_03265 [Candidatus Celerinatantimonas neptuna]
MRFLPVNLTSLLIEFSNLEETLALHQNLVVDPIDSILEMIPAACTLLIYFDRYRTDAYKLTASIRKREYSTHFFSCVQTIQIPVTYDGEDLQNVADCLGISVAEVIYRHTHQSYRVAFTGFAPGFAYLSCLENQLSVPRHASPRIRIPAGSVALAGEFSGIYPKDSPGGWQLIGRTDQQMWDLDREQPALLRPGDQVVFVDATQSSVTSFSCSVKKKKISLPHSDRKHGIKIKQVTFPILFQDQGRAGLSDVGISESGAMDRQALRDANRIVGNCINETILEITNGSLRVQVLGDLVICVTGAICSISVTTSAGDMIQCENYRPVALCDGDELELSAPRAGVRSYLSVRGGWLCESVLQSTSYDTLAQIGPKPIRNGNSVFVAKTDTHRIVLPDYPLPNPLPSSGDIITLDVIMGPHTDWFSDSAVAILVSQHWHVTNESNRIGLRLEGSRTLTRKDPHELPSEGTVAGSIQVPTNGQPVLFMRDHPLTGGYPVIAVIADYHLDLCGQLPVGCSVIFHPIQIFQEF